MSKKQNESFIGMSSECGWCGGPWNDCACNAVDGKGQRNFDADYDDLFTDAGRAALANGGK